MKKIVIIVVALLATNTFFGQSVFDKFNDQENVTSIIVNSKMFDLMSKLKVDTKDKETLQYMNLLKKLDNLKVFMTTNNKAASEMKSVSENFLKTSKNSFISINIGINNFHINFISYHFRCIFHLADAKNTYFFSRSEDFFIDRICGIIFI